MRIKLPELPETIDKLMLLESSFDSETKSIAQWLEEHRRYVAGNLRLIRRRTDANDLKVMRIFLRELLVRNIVGEGGERVYDALCDVVRSKNDLTRENYKKVLRKARYRWGVADGSPVMTKVVHYFRDELNWNWGDYLGRAEAGKLDNFPDDPLLSIKQIGFKVRDLALSNFNVNYAAFDLHVVRVVSRIGLIAYGWDLTGDQKIEFGSNPSDEKNYLFFHRLFLRLSELCQGRYTPVELDRVFWHLGRCRCRATTECATCPIHDICLTGRRRTH
jgi:hypothetical protein